MIRIVKGLFNTTWAERDGVTFAEKIGGKWKLVQYSSNTIMKVTRAQAFKLWDKHFTGRAVWDLPRVLALATDADIEKVWFTSKQIIGVDYTNGNHTLHI